MLKNGYKTVLGCVLYATSGVFTYLGMFELAEAIKEVATALIGLGVVHKAMKGQFGSKPVE